MSLFFEFVDTIQKLGLEYYGRYYSVYHGIVTDVDDPDQRGRVKIVVPSLLDDDQELPEWADPIGRDLAGDGTGSFFPPYVGDVVEVMFEHGDIEYPLYMGGYWGDEELPEDFAANYPNTKGWVFGSGQKILIDEEEGKQKISLINGEGAFLVLDDTDGSEGIYLQHTKAGSVLQITKEGNIILASKSGNLVFINEEKGEVSIKSADGSVVSVGEKVVVSDSTGKSTISMTGDKLEINADSDVVLSCKNATINSTSVAIGANASMHATIYEMLEVIFDGHIHQTVLGPTTPPTPPLTMSATSAIPAQSAKASAVTIKGNI